MKYAHVFPSLRYAIPGTAWRWALALVVACAYLPVLARLTGQWYEYRHYNHGFLVPAFALFLLWQRRQLRPAGGVRPSRAGWPLLALAAALYAAGYAGRMEWPTEVSLLPCLAGLCLLWGGVPALRWAGPAVGFLFFMIPLPYRAEELLAEPLKRFATGAATYTVQTLGIPAVAEGNTIVTPGGNVEVVESCSGLSILLVFIALSVAVALVTDRPPGEKLAIVASGLPIALFANVVRITLIVAAHQPALRGLSATLSHDLPGWSMMPLAVVLLWLELRLLNRLYLAARDPVPTRSRAASRN
jgi:exosortase